MAHSFEMPPQLTKTRDSNARRGGRVRCQWTHCNLGEILDLSITGMRVACRRKPAADVGSHIAVNVEGGDGTFDVSGKIVWKKKAGLFKWTVGIEFDELTPAARKGLTFLARSALSNDSIAIQDRMRKSA